MGWISLAVLFSSVSYLLYKHPMGSWSIAPLEWLRNSFTKPKALSDTSPPAKPESVERAAVEDGESPTEPTVADDSTPKATPVQLPSIDVPTFNLESPAVIDERPKIPPASSNNTISSQTYPPSPPTPTQPAQFSTAGNGISNKKTPMGPPPPPAHKSNSKVQKQTPSVLNPTSNSMLPPPRPSLNVPLRPPPSAASSLRAPPPRALSSSTLAPAPLPGKPQQKTSRQVILEPGHSPLDWAALTSNPNHKLRGENLPPNLIRVTPSMLKEHNGRKGKDAWTSYVGKVYNITPYLPFHPGGKGELLRGAGKDSGKLFAEIHPWVNWDGMLGECMVGILVSEDHDVGGGGGGLDEMD
ncbi:hypothetical protein AJ79_06143 [Helicocarpus griseus UAMH5409]|uniref:Cytochrome b5 heme-binding domain-containing protein n=1 Tax=Helicocarpus griseus UAMH5409 TaxID=1447875 RepID=A0A2B7XG86_9EURO|nr:hypothetical protein AJ79_06143 [Helicocarpus griseus UAMH5409]